jgi:hypothetical protein
MPRNINTATNNFTTAAENTVNLSLTSSIASAATTVPITGLATNYAIGAVVAFVIEPASATAKQVFTGIVDGAQANIINVIWTEGTNQAHSSGATIADYTTATHFALLQLGLLKEHNSNGTHAAITAPV